MTYFAQAICARFIVLDLFDGHLVVFGSIENWLNFTEMAEIYRETRRNDKKKKTNKHFGLNELIWMLILSNKTICVRLFKHQRVKSRPLQ